MNQFGQQPEDPAQLVERFAKEVAISKLAQQLFEVLPESRKKQVAEAVASHLIEHSQTTRILIASIEPIIHAEITSILAARTKDIQKACLDAFDIEFPTINEKVRITLTKAMDEKIAEVQRLLSGRRH